MKQEPRRSRGIGPGIVMAATGAGAGDLIAASVAGAKFGTVILWSAIIGAIIKFVVNEGIARWQLATGSTVLEGWIQHLPRFISYYFLIYLLVWSFVVGAALMAATGLAAHALIPGLSVTTWGIVHSVVAVVLVLIGRYAFFEYVMKFFMALMFICVMFCAVMLVPEMPSIQFDGQFFSVPDGSVIYIMGVIGGVGGSVTLLSYGYWIREKGWFSQSDITISRIDLSVAYFLIGIFGVAIMVISATVQPELITGSEMVMAVADRLEEVLGTTGKWFFLAGFWGAVFSSMLGVWQGVPYLFTDFVRQVRQRGRDIAETRINRHSRYYRIYILYLLYIAGAPMLLFSYSKPVWLVVTYAVTGALFMPLLAALLLFMNNQSRWVGELKNSWLSNVLLCVALFLFAILMGSKVFELVTG